MDPLEDERDSASASEGGSDSSVEDFLRMGNEAGVPPTTSCSFCQASAYREMEAHHAASTFSERLRDQSEFHYLRELFYCEQIANLQRELEDTQQRLFVAHLQLNRREEAEVRPVCPVFPVARPNPVLRIRELLFAALFPARPTE